MFFFNYPGRQQKTYFPAHEDRLRIPLAERLKPAQGLQKFGRDIGQWNFGCNVQLRLQIFLRKSTANKLVESLFQVRQMNSWQAETNSVSMPTKTRKQSMTRLQRFQQVQRRNGAAGTMCFVSLSGDDQSRSSGFFYYARSDDADDA